MRRLAADESGYSATGRTYNQAEIVTFTEIGGRVGTKSTKRGHLKITKISKEIFWKIWVFSLQLEGPEVESLLGAFPM